MKIIERFETKYIPEPNTGCFIWVGGSIDKDGYGAFHESHRLMKRAHRASYEYYKGSFDKSLLVLHTCDNPSCVNPSHLFLGTHTDNMRDKVSKGRWRGRYSKSI